MSSPVSSSLTQQDYEQLLAHAARQPDFVYLGSIGPGDSRGSLSGFSACALTTKSVELTSGDAGTIDTQHLAAEMEHQVHRYEIPSDDTQHSLTGGWIGLLSYEFGYAKEKRLVNHCSTTATPLLWAGFYLWTASYDRVADTYYLWIHPECPESTLGVLQEWLCTAPDAKPRNWHMASPFKARQSATDFIAGVNSVQRYIEAGDCYQANLSQEFEGRYTGDSWQAFQALAEANPTPYSAFLNTSSGAVISISPERFLDIRGRTMRTSPIKGTRPRGQSPEADKRHASDLEHSQKDRAENLMIVDLLRNDLSVHAKTGSVSVDQLFALESYQNVHHLVSHIRAELADTVSPMQALFDAFPGGSITGAPKIRAMEIIRELEPHWRGPYCGSVFYRGLDGTLDSSIAIRTLLCDRESVDGEGIIRCWGGGGIVADSESENEYQETLTKVRPLMDFLETL